MAVQEKLQEDPTAAPSRSDIPFDHARLDALMDEAGLDAILVTAKHNIQYLLGGYRYFFYSYMDAHGLSRYLPFLVYVKGRPHEAAYIGSPMEKYEQEHGKFWLDDTHFANMTAEQYAASAVRRLQQAAPRCRRVGVEMDFIPASALRVIEAGLGNAKAVDASFVLELLRAVKTPAELASLREASDRVVASMLAVFARHGEGATKQELADALRQEEQARGLQFEYALITMGSNTNRAPSPQRWNKGEIASIDSGGNHRGYIGDLCRMGVLGEPDQELVDLLGEIDAIQQAARVPITAGARGGDIYLAADALVEKSAFRKQLEFVAHGMGIVSHEAPWLTDRSSVPYPAYHADRPLDAGMVLSIETTLLHPKRGFIKLEDTVAVTQDGWDAFGDLGRGWNQAKP